eukprot:COSAG01_NODE_24921_length_761_cov_2.141994_1_plen_36_part_10
MYEDQQKIADRKNCRQSIFLWPPPKLRNLGGGLPCP